MNTSNEGADLGGQDTAREVFYALTEEGSKLGHRTAKLLALVVERLHQRGVFNDAELEALILESKR